MVSTWQFEPLRFKQDVPCVARPMKMDKMTCWSLVLEAIWGMQEESSKRAVVWLRGTL